MGPRVRGDDDPGCSDGDYSRAARPYQHAPVLPDGSSKIHKIRISLTAAGKPLIRLTRATVHGVVFSLLWRRQPHAACETTRLRPSCLARYSAVSARLRTSATAS